MNHPLLEALVGKRCLKTTANRVTGVDLLLHFGKWVEYEKQSERLTVTHHGELTLMVSCTWRIDGPDGPVIDAFNVHDNEQRKGSHHILEGHVVREVSLRSRSWDLTITFDGELELHVFCQMGAQPENWHVLGPNDAELVVGPDCDVESSE